MSMRSVRREAFLAYHLLMVFQFSILAGIAIHSHTSDRPLDVLDMAGPLLAVASIAALVRARGLLVRRLREGEAAERDKAAALSSDALTGVLSRRSFMEALRSAVRFDMDERAALLLIDVDHFKSFNDGFGHAVGDAVLQHLAASLRRRFPDAAIGRLGGDEFAVLIRGHDAERGVEAADAFLAELRQPRTIAGRSLNIGASIGAAVAPGDASLADDLVSHADLALYESKRRGRGCVTPFDRSMMHEQTHRRFVERELRAAMLLDELALHYQPITDGDGSPVAVEALVRWNHSLRGLIAPGEFIPIAEESTLIDQLGEWVLRRAARDAAALSGLRIGINISGAQLRRDELVDMVRRVFAETGCAPERFVFEITESVAFAATPVVLARLQALRDLGAKVSLDDFGTGNNGFQSLQSLPIDSIKVDRSYIQAMNCDPIAAVMVSAIGSIGRIQDLAVVAEGIEIESHRTLARAAVCTLFQGYLLGRPQPLQALLADFAPAAAAERTLG